MVAHTSCQALGNALGLGHGDEVLRGLGGGSGCQALGAGRKGAGAVTEHGDVSGCGWVGEVEEEDRLETLASSVGPGEDCSNNGPISPSTPTRERPQTAKDSRKPGKWGLQCSVRWRNRALNPPERFRCRGPTRDGPPGTPQP